MQQKFRKTVNISDSRFQISNSYASPINLLSANININRKQASGISECLFFHQIKNFFKLFRVCFLKIVLLT